MKYLKLFEEYVSHCPILKLTDEIIDEVNKFNTDEELLRNGGLSIEALDRAAYGFTSEDIKTLLPEQLNIKWKEDYKGVLFEVEYFAKKNNLSFNKAKTIWSEKVNLSEPIEVCYEKDKFWIEDGHHRYFAAKTLKKSLNVDLTIKQNPITKLGGYLEYDDFHRCIFKQVKTLMITESIDEYSKWKRNNITYRGVKEVGEDNDVSGMLGKGLYTVPLSNKSMAKSYGELYFVYNAKPKNPKIFQGLNAWEIWFQTVLMKDFYKDGFPDRRLFDKTTTIEDEVIKLGYDGIIIKGREMVNFKPEDFKYFRTEEGLKDYFYSLN